MFGNFCILKWGNPQHPSTFRLVSGPVIRILIDLGSKGVWGFISNLLNHDFKDLRTHYLVDFSLLRRLRFWLLNIPKTHLFMMSSVSDISSPYLLTSRPLLAIEQQSSNPLIISLQDCAPVVHQKHNNSPRFQKYPAMCSAKGSADFSENTNGFAKHKHSTSSK